MIFNMLGRGKCMNLKDVLTTNNGDYETICELKKSDKPILIYGCANHAELVLDYLKSYNLCVDAFIVDEKYWKKDFFIKEILVKKIEDYVDDIENYNIVIGFCDIEKSKYIMDNLVLLKTKFYLLWEPLEVYHWDTEYITENWDAFMEVYHGLADDLSRVILKELIKAKLNVSGKEMLFLADSRQYFNELTFCLNAENEIFVDCGAYNGDTIQKYIDFTNNNYKKIYAFEPNIENLKELKKM